MEYKSVKEFSNLIDITKKAGQFIEGVYLKSYKYTPEKEKNKENPKSYTVHVFDIKDESGNYKEVQMFGSGALDYLIKKVSPGANVKVVYEGLTEEEVETEHGKKRIHQFDVLVGK